MSTERADLAIIGAGAAGLMAAIWAGRTQPRRRIMVFDGVNKLGAKILVAGGGRCNVTHDEVTVDAYAGSSRNAIRKVLQRFDVPETIAFFREIGVELKREETGKLFPVTDSARTVLAALLAETKRVGVQICHPRRVEQVEHSAAGFRICGAWGECQASTLILATGGQSLPKSGSDGSGYRLAQRLGHSLTERIFPALVPLTLPRDHLLCSLSGLAVPMLIQVVAANGKILAEREEALLCTHFGLSGPAVLDISRYWIAAQMDDPQSQLVVNWWPQQPAAAHDQALQQLGNTTLLRYLRQQLPERLARVLCTLAGLDANLPGHALTRDQRRALVRSITALPLPVTGNRGFTHAEVTAGGVPLHELNLKTMASRCCPNLHLCGEICDVDGRIGGYNFQWAWASGYVAGSSAGLSG